MRELVYNFENGNQVKTYAEAVAIAKNEGKPFVADVVEVRPTYAVARKGALRDKYVKFFTKQ